MDPDETRYIQEIGTPHATILGSKQKPVKIKKLLEDKGGDLGFTRFTFRVSRTIQAMSPTPGERIVINDSHEV